MMRNVVMGLVVGLVLSAGSVFGGLYNYTESGMDGADWTVVSNGTWLGWATQTSGPDRQRITYTWSADGAGHGSQVAVAWTVPTGESITQIDFYYTCNTDPAYFTPTVYNLGATETLSSSTAVVWQTSTYGWSEGSNSLTFSPSDNVQKVALGLNVPKWGYQGFFAEFSDVVITTVPEPATIGFLAAGGLLLRRKK